MVSDRWSDPRAKLLTGTAWATAKGPALRALQLTEDPGALLAGLGADLDAAWRAMVGATGPGGDVRVDGDGCLHVAKDGAVEEPASLKDLRAQVAGMLPLVGLPELILEVMAWHPEFARAFTAVSGAATRLGDLNISIAALLTAHSLNIGLVPVTSDMPALTRDRLSHVD